MRKRLVNIRCPECGKTRKGRIKPGESREKLCLECESEEDVG